MEISIGSRRIGLGAIWTLLAPQGQHTISHFAQLPLAALEGRARYPTRKRVAVGV